MTPSLIFFDDDALTMIFNALLVANGWLLKHAPAAYMLLTFFSLWMAVLLFILWFLNTEEVTDFYVAMPTSDILTAIMQARSRMEEVLSWSSHFEFARTNASYRLLSALVSVPLMLMFSVCLAFSKSQKFPITPMTSCLATWILVWILIDECQMAHGGSLETSPRSCLSPVSTVIESTTARPNPRRAERDWRIRSQ